MVANMWKALKFELGNADYLKNKESYDTIADKIIYTGAIDAFLIISLER